MLSPSPWGITPNGGVLANKVEKLLKRKKELELDEQPNEAALKEIQKQIDEAVACHDEWVDFEAIRISPYDDAMIIVDDDGRPLELNSEGQPVVYRLQPDGS